MMSLPNVIGPATDLAIQADLDRLRLRTHAAATRGGALALAVIGVALVWALHAVVTPSQWGVWALAMAAASGVRAALTRGWRGLPAGTLPTPRWLWRFRAGLALQGLVCGAVAWLPASLQDPQTQWILLAAMISMTGSAMVLTQFDVRAGLMFTVPALLPLGLRLLALPSPLPMGTAMAALMTLYMLLLLMLSGLRVSRSRLRLIATQHAEADSMEGARDAERLLATLFDHAGLGITVTDRHLRLRAWNDQALISAGLDPALVHRGLPLRDALLAMARLGQFADLPGAPVAGASHEAAADYWHARLSDAKPGVLRQRRPDGGLIELRHSPLPDGGVVVFHADLTEREAERQALVEQQRKLALVLERTEQGFWSIDNDLRTTDANPAMCRMLGLSREALLGRSIYEFVDAEQAEVFRQQARWRENGRAGGYEITLRRADGQAVHCFNNATPIHDGLGRKQGALGLFSDISVQKASELRLRQAGELLAQKSKVLEDTLESLSQGVLNVDASGRCIAWNRRFLALLEIPAAFMQTRPTLIALRQLQLSLIHFGPALERLDEVGRAGVQRFLDGDLNTLSPRYQRVRSDGLVLEVVSHFGQDGSLVRTYTDITDRQTAEAALIAARDEAERANRIKVEFLSRMSHELRTPLNAILGFGQLLHADICDPLSTGQRERVRELMRGGRHLLALIDDVLDISCIEAGRLQLVLEPVDVAELATDCLGLMQPMAQPRRVALALGFEPQARGWRVQADPTRLRQVLINLLSNAIKFNREAGRVRLSAHWDGEFLVVEVADEGPGIPPAQLPRLFQAFERLDLDGAVEGTGIGLALSRQLAELMGGEIGVRSELGRGSVFWLRLPGIDDPTRAPVPAEPVHSGVSQARHSVLYIEDNPVNLVLMQGMLGHRPSIDLLLAELPEQGLAMAASHRPDLVLLDIQLPGIDGFEVLRRLRALPLLGAVPVVAVSANALPADLALAQRAGFAGYLSKPVDMPELLALMDHMLDPVPP